MNWLGFSRGLAIVFGVLLPIGETVRRWGHIDYLPTFLDDWLIGALLLWGAWATRDRPDAAGREDHGPRAAGRRVLCAAWGVTCGIGYSSFFGHLEHLDRPDVGPLPQVWLTTIIGVGWVLAIVAMVGAARRDGD